MPAQTDLRFHMAVLGSKMQLVVPHDFGINVGGHLVSGSRSSMALADARRVQTHLRHHGSRSNLFGNGFTFAAAPSPPAVASESIDIARLEHQAMNARRKRDEWYEYCPDEAGMRYYLWWRFRGYREWSVAHSRVRRLIILFQFACGLSTCRWRLWRSKSLKLISRSPNTPTVQFK